MSLYTPIEGTQTVYNTLSYYNLSSVTDSVCALSPRSLTFTLLSFFKIRLGTIQDSFLSISAGESQMGRPIGKALVFTNALFSHKFVKFTKLYGWSTIIVIFLYDNSYQRRGEAIQIMITNNMTFYP